MMFNDCQKSTTTMEQSVPNSQYKLVLTNFYFLLKLSESMTVNRRKRKERNNDKKKNQIRICLSQLYPINRLKNQK